MIKGTGIDIIEINRIKENTYNRFIKRIMTNNEQKLFLTKESVAGIFAAKEAALKALGTGLNLGISFLDIEIQKDDLGKPIISFHNKAKERFAQIGGEYTHLSISHEKNYAIAFVVIE